MSLPQPIKVSAKKIKKSSLRICQGDIFTNIEIIESLNINGDKIRCEKLFFPYVICLNQECDLETDFNNISKNKDSKLLHLAIAPAFIFEDFLAGIHWANIFDSNTTSKRSDTKIQMIVDNEIPRYHYINFNEPNMPELVIDFKHFFTINKKFLYDKLDQRLCSLDDLFKEKISQRFSYFISRIGLPTELT
jgi:hypothetical protein